MSSVRWVSSSTPSCPGRDRTRPQGLSRFRLLASFIAGRSLDIAAAPAAGSPTPMATSSSSHADASSCSTVARSRAPKRLTGAGSLDDRRVKALRLRRSPRAATLPLEGHRVLADLATVSRSRPIFEPRAVKHGDCRRVTRYGQGAEHKSPSHRTGSVPSNPPDRSDPPLPPATQPPITTCSCDRISSTQTETRRRGVRAEPDPEIIRSSAVQFATHLRTSSASCSAARDRRKTTRQAASCRSAGSAGRTRPKRPPGRCPPAIRFTVDNPGATLGVGGALHPEWDVHANRYRPDWCRVIDFPLPAAADVGMRAFSTTVNSRRRLSRVGLGPKVFRARADGDELDTRSTRRHVRRHALGLFTAGTRLSPNTAKLRASSAS